MLEESMQIWRYDRGRDVLFRIRRLVDNELRVDKIPMRHEQPLRYDWLHITNLLPEALEVGGNCVVNQVAVLLKQSPQHVRASLQDSWENSKTPSRSTVNTSKPSALPQK